MGYRFQDSHALSSYIAPQENKRTDPGNRRLTRSGPIDGSSRGVLLRHNGVATRAAGTSGLCNQECCEIETMLGVLGLHTFLICGWVWGVCSGATLLLCNSPPAKVQALS
ncbi:hypothetical protein HBI23_215350 [Parastagonospora nodorum]|nr:hypothetical protein HBH47_140920 [Parastagonospora nodorum]KAH5633509.1 hypothetical protein HBI23_215350 [Parastagonospora nodorum]